MTDIRCPNCCASQCDVYIEGKEDRFRSLSQPYTFYFCKVCRLRFQLSTVRDAATMYAEVQEKADRHTMAARREIRYEEEILLQFRKLNAGERILDVGTGDGWLLKQAKTMGFDCCGVDVSSSFAQIAEERSGVPVRVGTLIEANFPSESFDCINLDVVLMYIPNPVETFKEIRRLLKPGGVLRIHEYDPDSIVARVAGPSYWMYAPTHIAVIPRRSLLHLASNTGFRHLTTIAGTEASLKSWLETQRNPNAMTFVKDTLLFILRKIRLGNFSIGADTSYYFIKEPS